MAPARRPARPPRAPAALHVHGRLRPPAAAVTEERLVRPVPKAAGRPAPPARDRSSPWPPSLWTKPSGFQLFQRLLIDGVYRAVHLDQRQEDLFADPRLREFDDVAETGGLLREGGSGQQGDRKGKSEGAHGRASNRNQLDCNGNAATNGLKMAVPVDLGRMWSCGEDMDCPRNTARSQAIPPFFGRSVGTAIA